jgi:hypothetical protein
MNIRMVSILEPSSTNEFLFVALSELAGLRRSKFLIAFTAAVRALPCPSGILAVRGRYE